VRMTIGNVEKDVERVHIKMAGEPWGESLLEDGHVIRIRTIVTGVYRVVGEFDPLGKPLYHVQSHTIFSVD